MSSPEYIIAEKSPSSLDRNFLFLCAILLIILLTFLSIIALQTHNNLKVMEQKDLNAALITTQNSLNTSFKDTEQFIQYIGDEVLSVYNGKPESAAHLFKREPAVDNELNNFYSWTQLTWVDKAGNILVTPQGIAKGPKQKIGSYPLDKANKSPWKMHIGNLATRDNYTYLPVAIGIASDANYYVGAITSEILIEKLQRNIRESLDNNYNTYHLIIWDNNFNVLIDTQPDNAAAADTQLDIKKLSKNLIANTPIFIDEDNRYINKFVIDSFAFNIAISFNDNSYDHNKFWAAFLPNFYWGSAITIVFFASIYAFRRYTILPVINKLSSNLAEEIHARKEQDRFLEQILGGISGFLYRHKIKDNQIITEYVSEGCKKLTGYSPARYMGKNPLKHTDVICKDHQQRVLEYVRKSLMETGAFEVSYPIVTADGDTKWVLNQGRVIDNHDPDAILFEGLLTDITEMKIAESKTEEALKALKLSNEELEQFAYICSHDLKEPLRTIFSFAQLYKKDAKEIYLTNIQSGVEHMKNLIDSLLIYSQFGIQAPVKQEIVALEHVINSCLDILQGAIQANNANIVVEPLGNVLGDIDRLKPLFQNLISNSIKFVSGADPQIRIGGELENNMWRIFIKDNGIGISKENYDKIFELFGRLNSNTLYEGSGIGLAICKKIVERHGGKIWIESMPNQGTTFFFTLPAAT